MEVVVNKEEFTLDNPSPWTATYLATLPDFNGNAAVYLMEPPHEGYSKVVVSAVTGWAYETYIFGLEQNGEVNWSELRGSAKGTTSHVQVLNSIGYIVK